MNSIAPSLEPLANKATWFDEILTILNKETRGAPFFYNMDGRWFVNSESFATFSMAFHRYLELIGVIEHE